MYCIHKFYVLIYRIEKCFQSKYNERYEHIFLNLLSCLHILYVLQGTTVLVNWVVWAIAYRKSENSISSHFLTIYVGCQILSVQYSILNLGVCLCWLLDPILWMIVARVRQWEISRFESSAWLWKLSVE